MQSFDFDRRFDRKLEVACLYIFRITQSNVYEYLNNAFPYSMGKEEVKRLHSFF